MNPKKVFNPCNHQVDVLTAFIRFTRKFGYVYDGENRTPPTTANTDELRTQWKDEDKARLFLSCGVSDKFLDDFESTVTENEQTGIKFTNIVDKMTTRYTPNSNSNHYIYHRLTQKPSETFDDFVHRVKSEAELCKFKCASNVCNVRDTLIRDQLIVGTHSEPIRQDALKNQWQLDNLIKNGRITESGVIAASEIKTETKYDVNRTRTPMNKLRDRSKHKQFICWKCESETCKGYNTFKYHNKQCPECKKYGHAKNSRLCKGRNCKSTKNRNSKMNRTEVSESEVDSETSSSDEEAPVRSIQKKKEIIIGKILAVAAENLHNVHCRDPQKVGGRRHKPSQHIRKREDFHTLVIINNSLVMFLLTLVLMSMLCPRMKLWQLGYLGIKVR